MSDASSPTGSGRPVGWGENRGQLGGVRFKWLFSCACQCRVKVAAGGAERSEVRRRRLACGCLCHVSFLYVCVRVSREPRPLYSSIVYRSRIESSKEIPALTARR